MKGYFFLLNNDFYFFSDASYTLFEEKCVSSQKMCVFADDQSLQTINLRRLSIDVKIRFEGLMDRKWLFTGQMVVMLLLASCSTHYTVTNISRTRLLVDQQYDAPLSTQMATLMSPYNSKVDSLMSPVVGETTHAMEAYRPESPMSNWLPDVLVWSGKFYDEKPDFGVYNMGGIRASLAKGPITVGDVFDVAPFENRVTFLTLTGEKVKELMSQIAYRGGEGVSKEVRLVITKDHKLAKATIGGKEIDPAKQYRVVTLDYVSHGNDRMAAFKSGTDRREMTGDDALSRALIIKYFKEMTAQGKKVDTQIEGRIIVEE